MLWIVAVTLMALRALGGGHVPDGLWSYPLAVRGGKSGQMEIRRKEE